MRITIGTRLGPYEIVSRVGAGGMGEVWRARDSRIARDVAIKVLPESFAASDDRLRRFEQEARALSSLSHPHLCALYDVGELTQSGATSPYLVMELLEGETLREVPGGDSAFSAAAAESHRLRGADRRRAGRCAREGNHSSRPNRRTSSSPTMAE